MKTLSVLVLLVIAFAKRCECESDEAPNDTKVWCNQQFEAFLNKSITKNKTEQCCSRFAFIKKSSFVIDKCDLKCEKLNETYYCCMNNCLNEQLNIIFLNGTFNESKIKAMCLNSIRDDLELSKKYDAIIDDSIRKCVDECKLLFRVNSKHFDD